MLDDAFKLTVDHLFPPLAPAKLEQLGVEPSTGAQPFKVPGYSDTENMWGNDPFYILRIPGVVNTLGS